MIIGRTTEVRNFPKFPLLTFAFEGNSGLRDKLEKDLFSLWSAAIQKCQVSATNSQLQGYLEAAAKYDTKGDSPCHRIYLILCIIGLLKVESPTPESSKSLIESRVKAFKGLVTFISA